MPRKLWIIGYNYTTEKVKCSCDVKENININSDFKLKEIGKIFADMKNTANINILKCYKTVLKIKNLIYNYGLYIMSVIMLLLFISKIIFWLKSYKKTKKDLFTMSTILNGIDSKKSDESKKIIIKKKKIQQKRN